MNIYIAVILLASAALASAHGNNAGNAGNAFANMPAAKSFGAGRGGAAGRADQLGGARARSSAYMGAQGNARLYNPALGRGESRNAIAAGGPSAGSAAAKRAAQLRAMAAMNNGNSMAYNGHSGVQQPFRRNMAGMNNANMNYAAAARNLAGQAQAQQQAANAGFQP